ncbi:MAG TPA: hypothetical protein ENH80_14195 [Phycisphaerae bacterium]|nr:hypothetical protein [Phycisphaerae bacterium]
MKKRLSAFPANILQNLGLLLAFVLLMAANGFTGDRPVLTTVLVFVFSLSYLVASAVTRRASFLYGTMLLGAVSYFLACNALGAPGTSFPLLSVPLVGALLAVGHYLRARLPAELSDYPRTIFRAMNITAGVFGLWALAQAPQVMGRPDVLRYVAALTLMGYAGLYFVHAAAMKKAVHVYVFSGALVLGSVLAVSLVWAVAFAWIPAMASAGAILLAGTRFHRDGPPGWSRNFYFTAAGAICVSLVLSLLRWPLVIVDMALGSLLLWAAYGWLSRAVPDVLGARMGERVTAKCFFFGSMAMALPVAVVIFIMPSNAYVAGAALVCGVTFCWLFWRRRDNVVPRNNIRYVLAASMFVSAGLLGMARHLPGPIAAGWAVAVPIMLLAGLVAARRLFDGARHQVVLAALGGAAVFPAFFAWYAPLLQGEWLVALIAAAAALAVVVVIGLRRSMRSCHYAIGPALGGAVVCGMLLVHRGPSFSAWAGCAAAATLAGVAFIWAGLRDRAVIRGATNLAWLILSVAAAIIAGAMGLTPLLYAATAVGAVSVLMAARAARAGRADLFDRLVQVVAVSATVAVVVVGSAGQAGATNMGLCLLVLSAAYWLAWALGRGVPSARLAVGMLALAGVLVIYGSFPGVEARLALGAGLVAALFILAALTRRRFSAVGETAVAVGHLTSVVLALAALVQAWAGAGAMLSVGAGAMALIYALMPTLRGRTGFRVGTGLWVSFVAMLALAGWAHTPYPQQVGLLVLASLGWLAAGQVVSRTTAKDWSLCLYVTAAILAGFCSIVRMFAPAVEGSWPIFMVSGMVFASLFVILRQDVFAYLLTLSLSLMAFDWIKSDTSAFTQDVLFYLIIGGVVLAAGFILPYLWRALGRTGWVPIFAIFTRRGAILLAVVGVACTVLLSSTYSLELTAHPKFCTSCHNMGQYYNSWEHSAHQEVACIKCHYEPGITNTIAGKIGGLVQVVKYVSHAYDSKPSAIISNQSCMREGCHWDMDHSKETLLFKGQIAFRHDKHLGQHPRGKELNCVTCHGQTVEGQHISVSQTTCVSCHFYGRGDKAVAVGDCLTCHTQPEKPVTFMGQSFSHTKFLKGKDGVECSHCHNRVTEGSGSVSVTRCRSCHLGKDQIEVDDQEQFHLTHVSQGHFDCLQCHDEIKHGTRPMEQQLLAAGNCSTCHTGERHSIQERVYAGTVATGMKVAPDVMYKAGVACEGCHTDVKATESGATAFTAKFSGARQCVDCHGKKRYGQMLEDWQEATRESIAKFQPAVDELTRKLRSAKAPADEVARVGTLLQSAGTKLAYVVQDGSLGAHNYPYLEDLLFRVEEEIDACRSLMANWDQPAMPEGDE